MEASSGPSSHLGPRFVAAARNLAKHSKLRTVVATLLLYLCCLALTGLQPSDTQGRGKARGAGGKGKIRVKSANDSALMAEFGRRRKQVKDTCEKYGAYTTREKVKAKLKLTPAIPRADGHLGVETDEQLWSLIKKTSHHQFFVQKEHGLMWCKVPKAASTSWLHAFLRLARVPQDQIPEDNGMGLHAFLRDKYPMLSKNLNKQFMTKSIKFVVVRHPFERVVSAYVDKLQSYPRDLRFRGGYYYAMYGADIVARLRPKYQEKFPKNPLFMKKEPSFVEFVEYLVETPVTKYDEHWRPMFLLCPPCHIKFDVIVKMETYERDTQFILQQRSLENAVSLKKKHSSTHSQRGKEEIKVLFSQLSKQMVRALYDKYRLDFQLFEYDIERFIKHASESAGFMPDVIEVSNIEENENENENEDVAEEEEFEQSDIADSSSSAN